MAHRVHGLAPMTYVLTIIDLRRPGRPVMTMNEFERATRRQKTAAKHHVQWQIRAALQATPVPALQRATISIIQFAPNMIRRDADGLGAFRKHAIDAITRAGVFPDDNTNHVIDGGNTILLDRANPRIEIRIEPTP
ncbi:hypothetical protein B2J88_07960 [Rhodococcus sp. SRB_17]|nr:hypothetical protein [Rhodococcus sp. SRB_17]